MPRLEAEAATARWIWGWVVKMRIGVVLGAGWRGTGHYAAASFVRFSGGRMGWEAVDQLDPCGTIHKMVKWAPEGDATGAMNAVVFKAGDQQ
jgi:hypothetical protein